jgi:sec-independent protein translocase protein TatB
MIDIAWSEFVFVALLALILIGPKELPSVLRNIGRWVGKARAFAQDFSAQLDLDSERDDCAQEKTGPQDKEPPVDKKSQPFENTKHDTRSKH